MGSVIVNGTPHHLFNSERYSLYYIPVWFYQNPTEIMTLSNLKALKSPLTWIGTSWTSLVTQINIRGLAGQDLQLPVGMGIERIDHYSNNPHFSNLTHELRVYLNHIVGPVERRRFWWVLSCSNASASWNSGSRAKLGVSTNYKTEMEIWKNFSQFTSTATFLLLSNVIIK